MNQNKILSQKCTRKKPTTNYLNKKSTRMNLEQCFLLEMSYAKPSTSYSNKNSTRMNLEKKLSQKCTRKKPTTSYLNKNFTRKNLEQSFLLEMYYAKTYYKLFE